MTKYLINAANLDDLKKLYKKMAMQLHPDMGGSTEEMQSLNAEYEARFEVLKRSQNEQAAADTTGNTHATTEAPYDFINIISALLHMDGLSVELTGRWLWITGRTLEHKEELKAAGCRWCSSKKCWRWHHAEDGSKFYRGHRSMDAIRAKYGSEVFASHGAERQTIAG